MFLLNVAILWPRVMKKSVMFRLHVRLTSAVFDLLQGQITLMDAPVFKAIQPEVSCSITYVTHTDDLFPLASLFSVSASVTEIHNTLRLNQPKPLCARANPLRHPRSIFPALATPIRSNS